MSKLAEKLELSATLECDEYNKLLLFLMWKPLGERKLKKPHGESSLRHTPKELSVATNSRSCFKYELLIIIADKKNYPS